MTLAQENEAAYLLASAGRLETREGNARLSGLLVAGLSLQVVTIGLLSWLIVRLCA
jgi:hypothetical protein